MSDGRRYRSGTVAGLISLSRGSCYWPGCTEPVIRFVDEVPVSNLQIAHICALNPDGPRYNPSMSDEERRSFMNLILLCHPHHTMVDRIAWREYSMQKLHEWKREREKAGQDALAGLSGLTEERLQELLASAMAAQEKRVEDALERFAEVDSEAAAVLRDLIGQLDRSRSYWPELDEGIVMTLSSAADDLRSYLDEGVVNTLSRAAQDLQNLPDVVASLSQQVAELRRTQWDR